MHRTDSLRLPVQISVVVIVSLLYAFGDLSGAPLTSTAQDAKAEQMFVTVCGRCHPVERITATRRTRGQWEETITMMITARGAAVTDEEFDTILTYLTKEYGRVDVNRADADSIAEVLAMTDESAAAVVAYRKQHGPFEDFEALLKVPGLNRDALEKKRDAISF
jgi:competence ComEA-like helix-hairpin-helix protein